MAAFGGGPLKNIEHKHFWHVLILFVIIVVGSWAGYHWWIKQAVDLDERQQMQAQQMPH